MRLDLYQRAAGAPLRTKMLCCGRSIDAIAAPASCRSKTTRRPSRSCSRRSLQSHPRPPPHRVRPGPTRSSWMTRRPSIRVRSHLRRGSRRQHPVDLCADGRTGEQPAQAAAQKELRRLVHNLKGAAATVGYMAPSQLAHRLEDLMDAVCDGGRPITRDEMQLLYSGVDVLQDLSGCRSTRTPCGRHWLSCMVARSPDGPGSDRSRHARRADHRSGRR